MNKQFGKVTVLGEYAKNPRVPKVSVVGSLISESSGLVFKPETSWVEPFMIPWEDIEDTDWGQLEVDGLESIFWILMLPVVLLTLGRYSPVKFYTLVKFRDEEYGITSQVRFCVGGLNDEPRARELARTILAERGRFRASLRKAVSLHYLDSE